MNASVDCLIREHKISPAAGTSLINDSAYMFKIKKHLVDMAETVFVVQKANTTQAQRELVLDDNELTKVLQPEN